MSLLWGGGKLSESQYTGSTCRHILEQFQDSSGRGDHVLNTAKVAEQLQSECSQQ